MDVGLEEAVVAVVTQMVDDAVGLERQSRAVLIPVKVGREALLTLLGMSIGVDRDDRSLAHDVLQRAAMRLDLDLGVVERVLEKASIVLWEEEWDGYTSSLARTYILSCSNPNRDVIETMLWLVCAAMKDGNEWVPYDPRVRAGLRRVARWLGVPWRTVARFESGVLLGKDSQANPDRVRRSVREAQKATKGSWRQRAAVTTAATIGAGLLAVTGLLALPAVGAALTAVAAATGATAVGTAAAAMGGASGMIITGSTLGAAGAGLAGSKMQRRVDGVSQFEFRPIEGRDGEKNQGALTIAITGWVTATEDFVDPWRKLPDRVLEEVNAVVWEEKELIRLGVMFSNLLRDQALAQGLSMVVKRTILSGLMYAVAWPATVIGAADVIDNAWSVAMNRADAAAKVLADILMKNVQGFRPVSLIGYSLGARVIFLALKELAAKNRRDLVENVVFIGAPVTNDREEWKSIRRVTAGRVINAFDNADWVLFFVYRTAYLKLGVAGLEAIDLPHVENFDVREDLRIPPKYRESIPHILEALHLYS